MNCPRCSRDNLASRRYCGGCGTNLEPVCGGCQFVNDCEDRFCGGCGTLLAAHACSPSAAIATPAHASGVQQAAAAARAAAPPTLRAVPAPAGVAAPAPPRPVRDPDVVTADDLADLLDEGEVTPPAVNALPEGTVGQDDLDRLFGGMP